MNEQDATDIAIDLTQRWRNGLQTDVWVQRLKLYSDTQRARQAVEDLTITVLRKSAPDIADFHNAYNNVKHDNHHETTCTDCKNDGIIPAGDYISNGRTYSSARPCPYCRHGERAAKGQAFKVITGSDA